MPAWNKTRSARAMLTEKCHYCKHDAETRDHIVPRALGGRNAFFNLVPSCRVCNLVKANSMPTCTCKKCRKAVRTWEIEREIDVVNRVLDDWNRGAPKGVDQGDAAWNGGAR